MMSKKEKAIRRCAVFLVDRASCAKDTGDFSHLTKEKIEELLRREFEDVVEATPPKEN